MIRLRIEGAGETTIRSLRGGAVVVGRSRSCDLPLPDVRGVSRFHCRILFADGSCRVEDLGSRNSTLLNGHPVERAQLDVGDELEVGSARLVVEAILADTEVTEALVQPCLHCGHVFAAREESCPRCQVEVRRKGRRRAIGAYTFSGYRLLRRLGSGGMGIVFEAEDLSGELGRVALKVLRPHLARDMSYLVRFIEEMRLLTSLRHEAIVTVFGRGKEEDLHFFTMELVEGSSARQAMMNAGGALPWRRAVEIIWAVAKGLYAAQQQAGVVHGDLKPGNFLIDRGGSVKLCDFGLALAQIKGADDADESERRGTAAYAAPERFSGPPTLASDIYGLGVSLFHMVAGQLPFRGGSVRSFREGHRETPIPQIRKVAPGALPAIQLLLDRMMAKRPEERYESYPALLSDLGVLLS